MPYTPMPYTPMPKKKKKKSSSSSPSGHVGPDVEALIPHPRNLGPKPHTLAAERPRAPLRHDERVRHQEGSLRCGAPWRGGWVREPGQG